MRSVFSLAAIALVLGLIGGRRADGSRRDWVGSARCGRCHPAELAAWKTTPHATTARRWTTTPPPAKCLACHGTGEAPAGVAIAVEVGCEACHGSGADYAEDDIMRDPPVSRALGLVDLSTPKLRAAVCARCHVASRRTRASLFDPTAPVHPVNKTP